MVVCPAAHIGRHNKNKSRYFFIISLLSPHITKLIPELIRVPLGRLKQRLRRARIKLEKIVCDVESLNVHAAANGKACADKEKSSSVHSGL